MSHVSFLEMLCVLRLTVMRCLPVLPTLTPSFQMRRTLIQTSTDERRACFWSWHSSVAVKRNVMKFTATLHQRGSTSNREKVSLGPLKPKTMSHEWNSPVVALMWVRRSGRCVGPTVGGDRDWHTPGARLTLLPWLLPRAPALCHLAGF